MAKRFQFLKLGCNENIAEWPMRNGAGGCFVSEPVVLTWVMPSVSVCFSGTAKQERSWWERAENDLGNGREF